MEKLTLWPISASNSSGLLNPRSTYNVVKMNLISEWFLGSTPFIIVQILPLDLQITPSYLSIYYLIFRWTKLGWLLISSSPIWRVHWQKILSEMYWIVLLNILISLSKLAQNKTGNMDSNLLPFDSDSNFVVESEAWHWILYFVPFPRQRNWLLLQVRLP